MKRYILLLSAIFNIAITSYFTISTPLGMQDQVVISKLYTTLITPAGFTFSIWSLIYLSWFLLGIYILKHPKKIKKKSVYLLAAAQTLSTLWLIPSQLMYIAVSFAVMVGLLLILAKLLKKKQKNYYVSAVIQLFFGWILVASIANLHQTLVYFDVYYFPIYLSIASIIIGTVINFTLIRKRKYIPSFVFIWALVGIIIGQYEQAIIISATLGIFALGVYLVTELNRGVLR